MEASESAKKQENTGIGPASACRGESAFTRHESAATQLSCATAGRTKNQPAAVGQRSRAAIHCFRIVIFNELRNSNVSSRQQGQACARRYDDIAVRVMICSCA